MRRSDVSSCSGLTACIDPSLGNSKSIEMYWSGSTQASHSSLWTVICEIRCADTVCLQPSSYLQFVQARLVETGAKKLTQMYTKLVAEGSSGVPPNGPEFVLSPFPASLKPTLIPLVTFLRTLPLPPTHPSHPAAPAIQSTLKEAQKGYADMRGSWGKKCLENYARRVVDRAETIDGVAAGREFGAWVGNLLSVAEVR